MLAASVNTAVSLCLSDGDSGLVIFVYIYASIEFICLYVSMHQGDAYSKTNIFLQGAAGSIFLALTLSVVCVWSEQLSSKCPELCGHM